MGVVVGFGDDFVRQIERLKMAGVQRLMLQWIDLENTDLLEEMADHILPVFHGDDA